ncbi:hypothetical protein H0264_35580 [Nocardia huaxiensis]|uniref:Uncharacterized protein n=1 Tax=Nocardia huaxiensis TaxID=2755382 RepID=A0A7D6ZH60_9NOCA|nr:hypothetical protein [Nocardia huaxiensis]QLY30387.1 hypothetical protein H0264_35580 [Nocardia huaxiensis]
MNGVTNCGDALAGLRALVPAATKKTNRRTATELALTQGQLIAELAYFNKLPLVEYLCRYGGVVMKFVPAARVGDQECRSEIVTIPVLAESGRMYRSLLRQYKTIVDLPYRARLYSEQSDAARAADRFAEEAMAQCHRITERSGSRGVPLISGHFSRRLNSVTRGLVKNPTKRARLEAATGIVPIKRGNIGSRENEVDDTSEKQFERKSGLAIICGEVE